MTLARIPNYLAEGTVGGKYIVGAAYALADKALEE